MTNNAAEWVNSHFAVKLDGKRINFTQRSAFNFRVGLAVTHNNTLEDVSQVYKTAKKTRPSLIKVLEQKRKKKLTKKKLPEGHWLLKGTKETVFSSKITKK